jgi:CRP/FNR family transcriptional regulator, cyclic AMP receptor protein
METLEPLLREHGFLRGLGDEEIRFLVSCVKNLRFKTGAFLLREGGPADSFFLLRSGKVSLESDLPGRGPIQMERLGEGDVLGISWLLPPYRWQLDARALEPVTALVFDAACLRDKLESDHHLGYALTTRILRDLAQRLERVRLQRLDVYKAER